VGFFSKARVALFYGTERVCHSFYNCEQNKHTSAGISMGYAANESIISEIDTATVFLSTATRPRLSE
jgi:hypothetical protein